MKEDLVLRLLRAHEMQEGRGSSLYKEAAERIEGLQDATIEINEILQKIITLQSRKGFV